jgi:N-acetylglucosaminyldiphosphoundecaprenol N-acetyl-beta-D-mannosaminyltransferase
MYKGKFSILNNQITACDYKYVVDEILLAIKQNNKKLIAPVASQTITKAYFQPELCKTLSSYILLPDSEWIKRSLNWLYGTKLKERIYGPKLMLKLCKVAENSRSRIFLYGTSNKNLAMLTDRLRVLYPKIVLNSEASLFRPLKPLEQTRLINKINKFKSDIVFVALGSPLQEIFAYDVLYKNLNKGVIVTVGAAFDFISGNKKQAPEFVGNMGLEWLYRLIHEPKRLWKRYVIYGPIFVLYVFLKTVSKLRK